MKKSKFFKLINKGAGKHILFKENGSSHMGVIIGANEILDSITVQTNDFRNVSITRKDIIGKVKKYNWYSIDKMPPEDKTLLLEHKDGSIKMGRLLGSDGMEFYDLREKHFHDNYWHKPFPMSDFTHWSLVQSRS